MRQIKLRLFRKYDVWQVVDEVNLEQFRSYEECDYDELVEYTGLKDKNGKEIYEGDIIQLTCMRVSLRGKIVFDKGMFRIKGTQIDSSLWSELIAKNNTSAIIIGNIYEDGHLLW